MNRKSLNTFLIAAVAVSLAACNKENGLEQTYQDRSLSFDLSMAVTDSDSDNPYTRSMEIRSADGSIALPMEYRVTDGIGESSQDSEALTKGTQYNLLTELKTLGKFKVVAWNSDASEFIPTDTEVTFNSGNTRWELPGIAPLWKNADKKTFLAYTNLPDGATVTSTCTDEEHYSQTFSYTALQIDAADQKDALLGYYQGIGDSDGDGVSDGVAKVQFIHPLTAVVFKKGDFLGSVSDIKSLSLAGVYDGGVADVTYSYDAGGNLVPAFDWGTSLSAKTTVSQIGPDSGPLPVVDKKIGESFIIIPQDLSTDKVTINALVTVAGVDQQIMAELNTGEWEAGKTNTYTLNFDSRTFTYEFTFTGGSTAQSYFFSDTASVDYFVGIVNKKTEVGTTTPLEGEFLIESVQVGSGEPEQVNDISFENIGGFSAVQVNNSTLKITSLKRSAQNQGVHDYWLNQNPVRTDYLDWSPDDWTSVTGSNPIDLSKFNFQTETTDNPMTTANCYIIRHAGTYKLPLVYGNAVVNGVQYTEAFAPVKPSGAKNFLTPFMNHLGNDVTDAFIENNADCGGAELKCAIVWQDRAYVVKELTIVGDIAASYTASNVRYLQFTVDNSTICQNNALICVYKDANGNEKYDSGEAVWSWHIWTTNDPALLSAPISITNFSGTEYKVFPLENLGWLVPKVYPASEDVKIVLVQKKSGNKITLTVKKNKLNNLSVGCLYQFGRKDPIPAASVNGFAVSAPAQQVPYSTSILNPGVFYPMDNASDRKDWCNTNYVNLWNGNTNNSKTIYDPSPVGYRMPDKNAFTAFTINGNSQDQQTSFNVKGVFDCGWNFYTVRYDQVTESTETIFFAVAGRRSSTDGSFAGPNEGTYWFNTPYNYLLGYFLFFRLHRVSPTGYTNARSQGQSVRPVLE